MNIKTVADKFEMLIDDVAAQRARYVNNPKKDMTRCRKITFRDSLRSVFLMGGGTLFTEILDYYQGSSIPSVPAFVQQRSKIRTDAFETICRHSAGLLENPQTFEGYRLLAVDGSKIHIPLNRRDESTFFPGTNGQKPYNLIHLNSAYDILNNIYTDVELQNAAEQDENLAFCRFADRCGYDRAIFIADRGYESYNNMAHCLENGLDFLIRGKDRAHSCIKAGLSLPLTDEFDEKIYLQLTRKNSKETKVLFRKRNQYRWVPSSSTFDYLSKTTHKSEPEFYSLPFRIVRLRLDNGEYEVLLTSLDRERFPAGKLKELYRMRWGIETSFRTLKYAGGLLAFHSRKKEFVIQEIYARITMYNLSALAAAGVEVERKSCRLRYRVNNSRILHICRKLFLGKIAEDCAEHELQRSVSAIRENRSFKRGQSRKIVFEFIYRVA